MTQFVQLLVSGLAVGSILGIVALGFVLMFKSTDVFNFAQGDLVMVGAYLCLGSLTVLGVSIWVATPVALLLAAVLGLVIYRFLLRPMIGSPLLTMIMVTIALSLILQSLVVILWGPHTYTFPSTLPAHVINVGGVRMSSIDLTIIAVAALSIAAFGAFFRFTKLGLHMRAVAENPEAAAVVGINTGRMFVIAIVIATVLATIGGILLANLQIVSVGLTAIGLLAFPAAVLGGIRSIPGAVVGGLLIGVIGQLGSGYLGRGASTPVTFAVLLLVLLLRPEGILGKRTVVRV
ncbi:branched-chain amino acid ABC transporter permease [Nocardioides humi]|uniref:Branched-chain amino acid ABC transporter permease n=1 Tax=Nocardioides humi TaxID=449461 RepID=A0ABN2AGS5_9ACTN|nr:branched-chain amino acid ABC transporter permease [Nocardioides humi]